MKLNFEVRLPTDDLSRLTSADQTPEFSYQLTEDEELKALQIRLPLEQAFKMEDQKLRFQNVYTDQLERIKQQAVTLSNGLEATKLWVDCLQPAHFAVHTKEREKFEALYLETEREFQRFKVEFQPIQSIISVSGVNMTPEQLILRNQEMARRIMLLESELKIKTAKIDAQKLVDQQNIRLAKEIAYFESELIALRASMTKDFTNQIEAPQTDTKKPGLKHQTAIDSKSTPMVERLKSQVKSLENALKEAESAAIESKRLKLLVNKLELKLETKEREEELIKAKLTETSSLQLIVAEQAREIKGISEKLEENVQINSRLNGRLIEMKIKHDELFASEAAYHQKSQKLQEHIAYIEGILKQSQETNTKLIARVHHLELNGQSGHEGEEIIVETMESNHQQQLMNQRMAEGMRKIRELEGSLELLKADLEKRDKQVADLQSMLAESLKKGVAKDERIGVLERQVADDVARINSLLSENEQLKMLCDNQKQQLEDKINSIREVKALIEVSNSKCSELENQNNRLRDRITLLTEGAKRDFEAIVGLRNKVQEQAQQNASLSLEVRIREEKINNMRGTKETNTTSGQGLNQSGVGVDLIGELRAEIAGLNMKLAELNRTLLECQSENKIISSDLIRAKKELQQSNEDRDDLKRQLAAFIETEKQMQEEIETLKMHVLAATEENAALKLTVDELTDQLRNMQQENEVQKDKLVKLEQENNSLKEETSEALRQLKQAKNDLTIAQNKEKNAEIELLKIQKLNQTLDAQRKSLESLVANLKREITEKDNHFMKLKSQSDSQFARDKRDKELLSNQLADVKQRLQEAEEQIKQLVSEKNQLAADLAEMEANLNANALKYEQRLEEANNLIETLKERLKAIEAENDSLHKQILAMERGDEKLTASMLERLSDRKVGSSDGETALLRRQIEILKEELEQKKFEIENLKSGGQTNTNVPSTKNMLSFRNMSQREFLKDNFPDFEGEMIEKDEAIEALRKKVKELNATIKSLESNLSQMRKENGSQKFELENLRQKIESLEELLKKTQQDLLTMSAKTGQGSVVDIQTHNTTISKLQNETATAKSELKAITDVNKKLSTELEELNKRISLERKQMVEANAKVAKDAQAAIEKAQKETQKQIEETERMRKQITTIQQLNKVEIDELKRQINNMSDNTSAFAEIKRLSDIISKLKEEKADLRKGLDDYIQQLEDLKKLIVRNIELPKLSLEVERQIGELSDLRSQLEESKAQAMQLSAQNAQLQKELSAKEQELAHYLSSQIRPEYVNELKNSIDKLNMDLSNMGQEINRLRSENGLLQGEVEQNKLNLQAALAVAQAEFQNALAQRESEINKLKGTIAQLSADLNTANQIAEQNKQRSLQLEQQLSDFQAQHVGCLQVNVLKPPSLSAIYDLQRSLKQSKNKKQHSGQERKVEATGPTDDIEYDPSPELKAENDKLKAELSKYEQEALELKAKIAGFETNREDKLTTDLKAKENQLQELQSQLNALQYRSELKRTTVHTTVMNSSDSEGGFDALKSAQEEIALLNAKLEAMSKDNNNLNNLCRKLREREVQLGNELGATKVDLFRAQSDSGLAQDKLRQAEAKNEFLQKQIGYLSSEQQSMKQRINYLQEQLAVLLSGNSGNDLTKEIDAFKEENMRLKDVISQLNQKLEYLQKENQAVIDQVNSKLSMVTEAVSQRNAKMAENTDLLLQIAMSKNEIMRLKGVNESMEKQLVELSSKHAQIRTDNIDLSQKLRALELLLSSAQSEAEHLQTLNDALSSQIQKLKSQLNEGEDELQNKQSIIANLQRQLKINEMSVNTLFEHSSQQILSERGEVLVTGQLPKEEDAKSQANTADISKEDINPFESVMQELKEEINTANEKINQQNSDKLELQRKVKQLEKANDFLASENASLEEQQKNVREQRNEFLSKLTTLQRKVAAEKAALEGDNLKGQFALLNDQLDAANKRIAFLLDENNRLANEKSAALNQAAVTNGELELRKADCAAHLIQLSQLKQESDRISKLAAHLEQTVNSAKDEANVLRERNTELTSKLQAAEKKSQDLERLTQGFEDSAKRDAAKIESLEGQLRTAIADNEMFKQKNHFLEERLKRLSQNQNPINRETIVSSSQTIHDTRTYSSNNLMYQSIDNRSKEQLPNEQLSVEISAKNKLLVELTNITKRENELSVTVQFLQKKATFDAERIKELERTQTELRKELNETEQKLWISLNEMQKAKSESNQLKGENEQLKKRVERLTAFTKVNSISTAGASEADHLLLLEQRIKQMEFEAQTTAEKMEELKDKLDAKVSESASLINQLRDVKTQLSETSHDLSNERGNSAVLKNEREVLAKQITQLNDELNKVLARDHGGPQTTAEDVQKTTIFITKAMGESNALRMENAALKAKIEELASEAQRMNDQMNHLQGTISELSQKMAQLNNENGQLRMKSLNAEVSSESLAAKSAFLEEELAKRQRFINSLIEDAIRRSSVSGEPNAKQMQKLSLDVVQLRHENEFLKKANGVSEGQTKELNQLLNQSRTRSTELEKQNSDFKLQIGKLQTDLARAQNELSVLRDLMENLKQKTAEHSEKILTSRVRNLEPQVQYVINVAPESKVQTSSRRQLSVGPNQQRSNEPEPRRSKMTPQFLENELKLSKQELRNAQSEIERLQGEIEDWKAKFLTIDQNTAGNEKKIQFLNVVIENQKRELKDQMTKIAAMKAELTRTSGESDLLKGKLKAAQEVAKSKEGNLKKKAEEHVVSITNELKTSRAKSVNLQSSVDELNKERSKSQAKITDLNKEIARLKEELTQKEEKMAELEAKVASLEQVLPKTKDDLAKAILSAKTSAQGLGQAEDQISKLTSANEELRHVAETATNELNTLKNANQRLKAQLKRVEEESNRERIAFNEMLTKELERQQAMHGSDNIKIMEELTLYKVETDGLKKKLARAEQSITQYENSESMATQKVQQLEQKLQETRDKLTATENARQESENATKALKDKLQNAISELDSHKKKHENNEREIQRMNSVIKEKEVQHKRITEEVHSIRREQARSATPNPRSLTDTQELTKSQLAGRSLMELKATNNEIAEWKGKAEKLNRRVAELETELNQRKKLLSESSDERQRLEEAKTVLENEIRRRDAQLQSIRHENESLKAKLKFMEEDLKTRFAQSIPKAAEGTVTIDQNELKRLAQMAAQALDLESERDALTSKAALVEAELRELRDANAAMTAKLRDHQKRSSLMESSVNTELKDQLSAAESEIASRKRMIAELESKVSELRKLEMQHGVLNRDFASIKQGYEVQTGRILDLENELSDKKNQILRLQEQLNNAITNIQVRKEGVDPAEFQKLQLLLKQTQDELGKQRSSQSIEVTNISKKVQTFVVENDDLKRTVKALDARNNEQIGQISDLQNKLRQAEVELSAAKAALQKSNNTNADQLRTANEEISTLKLQITQMTSETQNAKEELERQQGAAAGQTEALQNQLIDQKNNAARTINMLKLTIEELTNELEESKKKIKDLELQVIGREKELKNQSKEFKKREKELNAKMNQLSTKSTVTIEAPKHSLADLEDVHSAMNQLLQTCRTVLEKEKNEKITDKLDFPIEERTVEGISKVHLNQAEKARQLVKELSRVIEASKNEFVRRKLAESALNASMIGGKQVSLETLAQVLHGTRSANGAVLQAIHTVNPGRTVSAIEHDVKSDEPAVYLESILQYIKDQSDNMALLQSLLDARNQELNRLKRMEGELRGVKPKVGTVEDLQEIDSKLRRSNKTLLEALRLLNISSVTIKEDVLTQSDKPESWFEQITSDFKQQFEIEKELLSDIEYLVGQVAKLEQRIRDLQSQKPASELSGELQDLIKLAFDVFGSVSDLRVLVGGGGANVKSANIKFSTPDEAYVNVNSWNKRNIDTLKDLQTRLRNLMSENERMHMFESENIKLTEEINRLKSEISRLSKIETQFKQVNMELEHYSNMETGMAKLKTEADKSRQLTVEIQQLTTEIDRLRIYEVESKKLKSEIERLSKFEPLAAKLKESNELVEQLEDDKRRLNFELARLKDEREELESANDSLKRLKAENEDLNDEIDRLKRQLKGAVNNADELERMRKLEAKTKALEAENDQYQKERTQFQVEIDKYKRELPKLNAEVQRLTEFEMTVTRATPQLENLKSQQEKMRGEMDKLTQENEKLKERVLALTKERDQLEPLQDKLAKAEKEIERLKSFETENTKLNERIAVLMKNNSKLSDDIEQLRPVEREANRLKAEIEDLKSQLRANGAISEKLASLERELARIKAENDRLKELETEHLKTSDKLRRTEREKMSLEAEADELRNTRVRSKTPTVDMETHSLVEKENFKLKLENERLKAIEPEIARLNERVMRLEATNRTLTDELEVLHRTRRPGPEPDYAKLEGLEREVQRLRIENARMGDLQGELARANDKVGRLEKEIIHLNAEIDDLRRPKRTGANLDAERAELLERELQKLRIENDRLRLIETEAVRNKEAVARADALERELQKTRIELERLRIMEPEVARLSDRATRAEREAQRLTLELEAAASRKRPLNVGEDDRLEAYERDNRRLRAENERLKAAEDELSGAAEKAKRLQRENKALLEELEELRGTRVRSKSPIYSEEDYRKLRFEVERLKGYEEDNAVMSEKLRKLQRENKSLLEELENQRTPRTPTQTTLHTDEEFRRLRIELERLRGLEDENYGTAEKLKRSERENKRLLDELEEARNKKPRSGSPSYSESEVKRLRAEIDRLRSFEEDNSNLSEKLRKLTRERNDLLAELEEFRTQRPRVKTTAYPDDELQREVSRLRSEIDRLRPLETTNMALAERNKLLEAKAAKLEEDSARLARAEAELRTLKDDLSRYRNNERENATLMVQIERLKSAENELIKANDRLVSIEAELLRAQNKIKDLTAENERLRNADRESAKLRVEIERLQGVEREATRLKDQMNNAADLQAEIQRLLEKNKALEEKCTNLEDENVALKRELAKLKSEMEDAKKQLPDANRLAARAKAIEKENEDLRAELEKLKQKVRPLESENKDLRDQLDNLTKKLRMAELDNARLTDELDRLQPKLKALDNENKELKDKIDDLTRRLKQSDADRQALQDEIGALKPQIRALENENKDLKDQIDKLRSKLNDSTEKDKLLNAFQRLIDPEIKNAANLKDVVDMLEKQPSKPFDTSPVEFAEPIQVIDYLTNLQGQNRPNIQFLGVEVPKLLKNNQNLNNDNTKLRNSNNQLQAEVDDLKKKLKDALDRYDLVSNKLRPVFESSIRNKSELEAALQGVGVFVPRASMTPNPVDPGIDALKLVAATGLTHEAVEKLIKALQASKLSLQDQAELPDLIELAKKIENHRKQLIAEFNAIFSHDFVDQGKISPRNDQSPKSVVKNATETIDQAVIVWEEFRAEMEKRLKALKSEVDKLRLEKDRLAVQNRDLEVEISKKIGSISKLQIKIFMLMSFLKMKVKGA